MILGVPILRQIRVIISLEYPIYSDRSAKAKSTHLIHALCASGPQIVRQDQKPSSYSMDTN